jgi:hypothetical protein
LPRSSAYFLLRVFCCFLIAAGLVAACAELFMWSWIAGSQGQHDIEARGPFLWALFAPPAVLLGSACAAVAAYLSRRKDANAGAVALLLGVLSGASVVAAAFVRPELVYLGSLLPPVLGRTTALSFAAVEVAVGVWALRVIGREAPPALA